MKKPGLIDKILLVAVALILVIGHVQGQKVSFASGNLNAAASWADLIAGTGNITTTAGSTAGTNATASSIAVNDALFDNANNFIGIVSAIPTVNSFTLAYPAFVSVAGAAFKKQAAVASGAAPAAGTFLVIRAAHNITVSAGFTTNSTIVRQGTITTPLNLTFGPGSTYIHYVPFLTANIPVVASWDATSTCLVYGANAATAPSVASLTQTFGNFIWNCPSQGLNNIDVNFPSPTTIEGSFSIVSTGTGTIRLTNFTARTLNISGDLNISGGTLNMSRGASIETLNLSGNFNMSGGTLTESGTSNGVINFALAGTQTFTRSGGTISNTINFNVNNGSTLDMGTNILNGSTGTFTVAAGGGLILGDPNGITSAAASGNVQVTGVRTYNTGNYTYEGTSAQVTGNGLPATVTNLTINNSTGVSLSQGVTVNGTLTLQSGALSIGANTLALANGSSLTYSGGSLTGGNTSNMTIGTGTAINPLNAISGGLNNFSISRNVTLGSNLAIAGNLTVTGSTLDLVIYTANRSAAGGTLSLDATSSLLIGGTNTFPSNYTTNTLTAGSTVNYDGTNQNVAVQAYSNLTLSGSGIKTLQGNITPGGNLTVTGSTFDLGTFTANRSAAGGTLSLDATSSLLIGGTNTFPINYTTNTLTAGSTVSYDGTNQNVAVQAYSNLTVSGSGTKILQGNITPGGNLTITGSAFDLGTFTANRSVAGGTLSLDATSTLLIGGTNSFPSNYTTNTLASGSTVNYNGTAQTVRNLTYSNLTLSGSGLKTTSGTVNGILSMEGIATASSVLTFGANATLQYKGSALQTTGPEFPATFGGTGGVIINNSNGVNLGSSVTITNGLTLTAGTFAVGANTLTLNGPAIAGTPANLSTTSSSNLVFGGSSAGVGIPSSVAALNNLTINNASGVGLNGSCTLAGTLTLTSGNFNVGANTLALNGPAIAGTPNNLITAATSSLSFGGSSSGVTIPGSVTNLSNLTINNTNGITLNGNITVSNIVTMTQGNITTGANTLILSNGTSGNLAYTAGTIIGKFQRAIALPTGTQYLFPVGTAAVYNPLKITFSNLTAGQLAVQFQPSDIGTAGLPLNDAGTEIFDRQTTGYWTLTAVAPMASTDYTVNLNYSGFSGVDALARILKRTNGGNLTLNGTHGTVINPEITRTGLSGISTTTTDLAIGKPNPRFTTQPSNTSGCNATFSVVVSGKTPLIYQWQEDNGGGFSNILNGGIYSGATSSTLTISGATISMNGYLYRCIVTDALNYTATSNSASLTLTLPAVSFGYNYSTDITLNAASGTSDLTDFPVLISITTSPNRDRLRTIANGGHVSNASGYDIAFTDQNGNKLDHQIEYYDAVTGQYVSWVRIPLLSHTSTTTIKMLYGNAAVSTNPSVKTVWASNYKGVWHLNGTDYTDATINANNGTENATSNVTGKIAGARGFNGTTSYIITPTNGFVPNNNNQTISIWANYAAAPGGNRNLITFQNAGASSAIQLGFRGGNTVAWKWGGVELVNGGASPSINTWHYYVYTFDGTTSRLYIDGVEKNNSTVAPQTAMPSEGNIGRYNNGEYLAANLDEPRFSMSPKSAGWILTEYNNQNDPASFLSVGTETADAELPSVGVCSTTYPLDQGSPSGGTYSGPGVTGTNFNASVAGAGTHQITYLYTDALGCSNSAGKNIVVTAAPSAPAASNKFCCYLNIVDLDATGTNLKWYSDAGLTVQVGTGSPFATGRTTAGVYTYYVTQTVNGCESTATTVTLTVYDAISLTGQPQPSTICQGDNTSFTVTVSGYNLSFQWQENGVNISNGGIYSGATTTMLSLTNPGIAKNGKLYRCVVSSSCGASPVNSNTALLTVTTLPVATFSYTGTPYCPNAANPSPTFSGGGVAGIFSSTPGLVFVSTATGQVNLAASAPGPYTVTNTIAAAGGCGVVIATSPITIISNLTWTGAVSTDWNDAGNWSCGLVPLPTMIVQIPDVANKPVLSTGATGTVNNLIIDNGSSLSVTGNKIQISGTITNNGTFTSTNGTIEMNGSAAQSIGANTFAGNTIKDLVINNPAGVSLLGPLNITGVVAAQTGDLASGGNLILVSDASRTALIDGSGAGTVTGNVTMQRYLPVGFGYKYFSSPFQAATVNEFADDMTLGPYTRAARQSASTICGGVGRSGSPIPRSTRSAPLACISRLMRASSANGYGGVCNTRSAVCNLGSP